MSQTWISQWWKPRSHALRLLVWRSHVAGHHRDASSSPLFPVRCLGDWWHATAGESRGGCQSLFLTMKLEVWKPWGEEDSLIETDAKNKDSNGTRLDYVFFYLAACHIVFLLFFFASVSPAGAPLPSFVLMYLRVIMLLSKSLLPERSLVELIFGWYYITAPLSSPLWLEV